MNSNSVCILPDHPLTKLVGCLSVFIVNCYKKTIEHDLKPQT